MSELDYLFLEDLFIQRVRNEVPGLADVCALTDLPALEDQTEVTPAVYVIYLGDGIVPGAQGQGGLKKAQMVKQYWAFVVAVSTADATNSGEAARREAGPLLGKLMVALQGWRPSEDVDPLCRAERQAPVGYQNGFFYYPIVFTTTFVFPRRQIWAPTN